ncbi:MAG: hypothetical protein ACKV19_17925 [Verrucomicrobiales bacterium]
MPDPSAGVEKSVVPGYGSITGAAGTTAITPLNTSTTLTPGGQWPDYSKCYRSVVRNR